MIALYNVFSCFFRTWSKRFFCCSSIRYSRYTQCDVDPRRLWYLWWDIIFETRQCLGHFGIHRWLYQNQPVPMIRGQPPSWSQHGRDHCGGWTEAKQDTTGRTSLWVSGWFGCCFQYLSMLVGIWASSNLHLRFPLLVLLGHLFWCIHSWQSCALGSCGSFR